MYMYIITLQQAWLHHSQMVSVTSTFLMQAGQVTVVPGEGGSAVSAPPSPASFMTRVLSWRYCRRRRSWFHP